MQKIELSEIESRSGEKRFGTAFDGQPQSKVGRAPRKSFIADMSVVLGSALEANPLSPQIGGLILYPHDTDKIKKSHPKNNFIASILNLKTESM